MNMKHLLVPLCLAATIQFAGAQTPTPAAPPADAAPADISGKVVETITTAGYTYVRVDTGAKQVWATAPAFAVKQGDTVSFSASMPMANYHSKSLNRDFDTVYFTGSIAVNGGGNKPAALPPGHPAINNGTGEQPLPPGHPALGAAAAAVDLKNIPRAKDGQTVQEIIAAGKKLAGKEVTVRGKIVKYNAGIMDKNWLHIRDGSGDAGRGDNDLTVTTATDAKPGDTVLVTGKVSVNKDFGAGYKYAVILEDAKVTVE
jgi:GW (Gly-Tryp) dipeptide domain